MKHCVISVLMLKNCLQTQHNAKFNNSKTSTTTRDFQEPVAGQHISDSDSCFPDAKDIPIQTPTQQ